jgi:hypothetical protein
VDGITFSALSIPGFGYTGERGKPQLPIKGMFVGIPPGAQPTLKILAGESRRDTLAHPPIPVPTKRISSVPNSGLPRDLGDDIIPDAGAYSANQNYPADAVRITSVGDWRSQHFVVVEFQPLQYNPATRQLLFHRRLRVEIALNYPSGRSPQTLGSALNEGPFEATLQKALINYDSARNWRAKSTPRQPARRRAAQLSPGPWYKIAVDADGIQQITCAQLASAGATPGMFNPSTLQVFKQDTELAINVVGSTWNSCTGNDYIEFFGQAANTKYATGNVYWLTYGGTSPGKRMLLRDGSGVGSAPTTITTTLHVEKNLIYVSQFPAVENHEHWYWDIVGGAWAGYPVSTTFPVAIDYLGTDSVSATLQVNLVGWQPPDQENPVSHYTRVYLNSNPTPLGDITWSGSVTQSAIFVFPQAYLNVGSNTIWVNEPNSTYGDLIYVDYFKLSFTRPFTASNDSLRFRQTTSGSWLYKLTGFTNTSLKVFDITDPFNVAQITPTITAGSPDAMLEFTDASAPPREYIALATAQRKTPTLTRDVASDLRNTSNRADYIIISHGSFTSTVQPLAAWRATQNMHVKVVDVQDVYDEFSDGLIDPQAIRDFLAYASDHWQTPAPSFVLLVGDGTYDPKGYCATPGTCLYTTTPPNSTLIPPFLRMVDPWLGETASDNRFVAFRDGTGNKLPQMHIGRLPVNNASEASAMVNKILIYEQNPPAGAWRSTVSFVADSKYTTAEGALDDAGDFWAASDEIYNDPLYTPSSLAKERIYYNRCPSCSAPYPTYPTAAATLNAITAAINDGRLIVNYVGHGAPTLWSNDRIFHESDVNGLANGNKLPVMLELTCYTGYFHYPGIDSLAEVNVRAAGKGALASWAPSGWGLTTGHSLLHKGFLDAVMNQREPRLGPAASYGKSYLMANSSGYEDLIDTYLLLGDPASRLPIQYSNRYYFPLIQR